jgi:hypothetical protein
MNAIISKYIFEQSSPLLRTTSFLISACRRGLCLGQKALVIQYNAPEDKPTTCKAASLEVPVLFHVVKIFLVIDTTQNFNTIWNTAGPLALS